MINSKQPSRSPAFSRLLVGSVARDGPSKPRFKEDERLYQSTVDTGTNHPSLALLDDAIMLNQQSYEALMQAGKVAEEVGFANRVASQSQAEEVEAAALVAEHLFERIVEQSSQAVVAHAPTAALQRLLG